MATRQTEQGERRSEREPQRAERAANAQAGEREMPCPQCGHPMPDLKGGKDTICPVCGFKDSCCY